MKRLLLYLSALLLCWACADDDAFTTSSSARLVFSTDTVRLDTVFATVPSRTYDFWVYNQANKSVRLESVRLRSGNQTGFRVNVDGAYLDNALGSIATGLELRKGDSLRVFVELTTPEVLQQEPQLFEDDLVFRLESGVEQKVNLRSYAWDALQLRDWKVTENTTFESEKPVIVYGGIEVAEGVQLTIRNTTLYFHDSAALNVYGTLVATNTVMRGDRLDHMFDYLPYDRVSGQWEGVRFHEQSFDNYLYQTEIRNAHGGIVCDSTAFDRNRQRLYMERCIVHNCDGPGLSAKNSYIGMLNCQITNTQGDCLAVYGGALVMAYCTLAQFYPFTAERGVALRFSNRLDGHDYPLYAMNCTNSLITGYDDDVVMGEAGDNEECPFDYSFTNCLLRTPVVDDSVRFVNIVWETPKDSLQGKQHFQLVDEDNLIYNFQLDSLSTARGKALHQPLYNTDLLGRPRKKTPDIGCYEYSELSE